MNTKITIRNKLIWQRKKLTPQDTNKFNQQISDSILSSAIFNNSNTVALYMSINNEVSLLELLTCSKTMVLPVIQPNNTMTFNHFKSLDNLVKNKYGILEPKNNTVINPKQIDLCLIPLVGFNRKGDRLGMGGGYYDRYFALNQMQGKPTILAGIAYGFQEDATIRPEPWDIPLDLIITNKEIIKP